MNRKELVKRLKYMIKSVAPNSQTILYGSEARGEAKQNSDIDILILVDKDKIESSNINRQLLATTETIDQVKVIVMKKRIQTLNPECKVDMYDCFYDCSMDEKIFSQRIDFVIDCIDSIKSKQDLAMACIQRDIPFLSSMGTARRLDPSKLEIMELEKTSYDPIAKRMRNWKRKNKIRNKIWVVCSTEPPRPVEAGKPLPSMIFVPASAGLLLASECVKKLINK